MRRNKRRGRGQAAAPIIVVSDDDSEGEEDWNPGPHPWSSRTVAAAAAAAAAITRAEGTAAETVPAAGSAAAEQRLTPQPVPAAAAAAPAAVAAPVDEPAGAETTADDAGASCTICLEPLYEEGSHRPAALKCGHIFGHDCIKKWLQQSNKCPQCNQRAKARELTLLYNLPKLAAGSAPEDVQRRIQELEASKHKEQERAAELERSLKELQRQLAMKEHQQLLQQQQRRVSPLPPGVTAGCGLPSWQQQQQQHLGSRVLQQPHQQVPPSGPGRPASSSWNMQYQQQQPQQLRPPMQPIAPTHLNYRVASPAAAGAWQLQQLVGQKRPWQQAAGMVQQPQQQQQPTAATEVPITWPMLTLQPVSAANLAAAAGGSGDAPIGPAGVTAADGTSRPLAGFAQTMSAGGQPLRRHLPGCFSTLQEFELSGSRSFYLDVPGTMALIGETPGPGCSRLRKISLVCPGQLSYLQLPPSSGPIRCLASHKQLITPGSSMDSSNINPNYLAVTTDKAGLLIASLNSNNVVQTIPVSAPVWSVAWSPLNSQQLLLGLDKGRIAVADIRKSSSQALLLTSNASNSCRPMQPLHSLLTLQPGQLGQLSNSSGDGPSWEAGAAPEAVVACAGGVYSWSRSQPDHFSTLLPSSCHGGNCESIALAADGLTLAVSFRSRLGWSPAAAAGGGFLTSQAEHSSPLKGAPVHVLSRLGVIKGPEGLGVTIGGMEGSGSHADVGISPTQPATAAGSGADPFVAAQPAVSTGSLSGGGTDPATLNAVINAGQQQLMQQTLKLYGHNSSKSLTHGCFIHGLPGFPEEQQLFLSADEHTCQPSLWACSSDALLEQGQPWQSLPSHILQLGWGQSATLAALLVGAMSDRRLVLYNWQPDHGY